MEFIQVGVGGHGRRWLGVALADHTASLAAVVDTDEEALNAARVRTNLPPDRCFDDYGAAFEQVEADAVLCAGPPSIHADVALAAFENGLHVLTEKPLADTMERAQEMVEAADAAGRTLMVSQNYRFYSWVRTLRHLVDSREFGDPDNLMVRFAKAPQFEGSFRLKMEHPLVRDMSIHHFDLMRAVTGREPVSVYAETWRPEWSWFNSDPCAVAIFQFTGGMKAIYHGSWVARGRETTWNGRWTVECAEAVLHLTDDQVHIRAPELPEHDTTVALHRMPCESLEFSLLEFQSAVEEGREPECSGRDNLNSLAMVFAVTESAARGEPVRIDEIRGTA